MVWFGVRWFLLPNKMEDNVGGGESVEPIFVGRILDAQRRRENVIRPWPRSRDDAATYEGKLPDGLVRASIAISI